MESYRQIDGLANRWYHMWLCGYNYTRWEWVHGDPVVSYRVYRESCGDPKNPHDGKLIATHYADGRHIVASELER